MTPRELIDWCEQEAREADQFHPAKIGANVAAAYRRCARELRAALPEQPLVKNEGLVSRVAEVIFRTEDKPPGPPEGPLSMYKGPLVKPYYERAREVLKEISANLDTSRKKDRDLLWEAADTLLEDQNPLGAEIRKHLEGESDE